MVKGDTPHGVRISLSRAAWALVATIKNAFVSDRRRYLKIRRGPARGALLYTSYRFGTRMVFGFYESELTPYVRRFVRRGDVCYDIGAADGYYGLAFARLAAPGLVHCFDLDDGAVEQLRISATRNAHLGSTISVHRVQIGAQHVDETHTSIDALVFERGYRVPNVMKLDVEGAELDVLRGAEHVLRKHRPCLIIEVHSQQLETDCLELLRRLGYTATVVANRAVMAEHAFRMGHNRWLCAE